MRDTNELVKCPACGQIMEKISISGKNFKIDVCTQGCGGIFFDNREFEHFDEQHENIEDIMLALKGKTFNRPTINTNRICPNCLATMVTNGTVKNSCLIDICYSCGGKFLDNNELIKFRNEFPNEQARSQAFNSMFIEKYAAEFPSKVNSYESIPEKIVRFFKELFPQDKC